MCGSGISAAVLWLLGLLIGNIFPSTIIIDLATTVGKVTSVITAYTLWATVELIRWRIKYSEIEETAQDRDTLFNKNTALETDNHNLDSEVKRLQDVIQTKSDTITDKTNEIANLSETIRILKMKDYPTQEEARSASKKEKTFTTV